MSQKKIISLSDTEVKQLQAIASSDHEPTWRRDRARILLLCNEGYTISQVASLLGITRPPIYKCLDKFHHRGWASALSDKPRSGRPVKIGPAERNWIRALTSQRPTTFGYNDDIWTLSLLRRHVLLYCVDAGFPSLVNISKSTIWSILHEDEAVTRLHVRRAEANNP